MKIKLSETQRTAVNWLVKQQRCILGDSMGGGKTIMAFTAALYKYLVNDVDYILIVTKASLLQNWASELFKHFKIEATIAHGKLTQQDTVTITSFQHLRKLDYVAPRTLIIVDECQAIKNSFSKVHRDLWKRKKQYMYFLSGTPIDNKYEDLFGYLRFFDENFEYYSQFQEMFCTVKPLVRNGRKVTRAGPDGSRIPVTEITGYKNLGLLTSILEKHTLSRSKEELNPDLKQHTKIMVDYEVDEATKQALISLKVRNNLTSAYDQSMVQLQIMQGFWDNQLQFNAKTRKLIEILDQHKDEQVVIWSPSKNVIEWLSRYIDRYCFILHGGIPVGKRQAMIDEWQASDRDVLLSTIQVGGVGYNMTACKTAIFFGVSYKGADNIQAEDRLHRRGQRNPVTTYYLLGTIDGDPSLEYTVFNMATKKVEEGTKLIRYEGKQAETTTFKLRNFAKRHYQYESKNTKTDFGFRRNSISD